jgi:integrase/recombinase XerD
VEALSKPELIALLTAAKARKTRDWLMILVAYSHGLRASEVCGSWLAPTREKKRLVAGKIVVTPSKPRRWHPGLTAENIDSTHITVARLKGSLRTIQPLVSDGNPLLNERESLFAFARSLHGKQRLFPITRQHFWKLMQRYAEAAGIPERKRHPHVLKHTIAMQVIHSAGIENTRQYLGHKSMSSTGAYLKVSDAMASQAVAIALKG